MDLIFIEEMRVEALVGIFEREKVAPQTLEINLTFGVPDEAAQSDDIARTIRYDEVIERIRDELANQIVCRHERMACVGPLETKLLHAPNLARHPRQPCHPLSPLGHHDLARTGLTAKTRARSWI